MTTSGLRDWIVPWVLALGVTIALVGLAWMTVRIVGVAAVWIMIVVTSIWAAYDSGRVRIQRYRTQMANEPFMVLYLCLTFWPIVFPWYPVARLGIGRGLVPARSR